MKSVLGMCFDWRVLLGLGAVGVGVWTFAPEAIGAALPLLLVAVCPVSMLVMAWMMRGSMGMGDHKPSDPGVRLQALEGEQARLDLEIARARADLAVVRPEAATRTKLTEV